MTRGAEIDCGGRVRACNSAADLCSVNCLSINAGKAPYAESGQVWSVFLEVIVHWNMIICNSTYAMSAVNVEKNIFHCSFVKYSFFRIAWKTTSWERKSFFAICFCEISMFSLGIFTIFNFSLRNLKSNGNFLSFLSFFLSFLYITDRKCIFFGSQFAHSLGHSH